jgi:hypothetical protein
MSVDNPSTSPEPQLVLERLLGCMTTAEREDLILILVGILIRRDPDQRVDGNDETEDSQCESNIPEIDDWIMSAWPPDWPGRNLVELDNVGDPGAWLSNLGGERISQVLFGWAWDDETNAIALADEYLREIRLQNYPLPSDFGDAPCPNGWSQEDEQQIRFEFMAFLRHWRECVLQKLERENSSGVHSIRDDVRQLTLQEINQRVDDALGELWAREAPLLAERVNERSITHHLAFYLQRYFTCWNVDVEYNRNMGDIKRLCLQPPHTTADDTNAVTVYPDIIIHRRGTEENLMVVEVKKAGCGDHAFDHRKLEAFTRPAPNGLGYRWGVHVVLPTDLSERPSKTWFENGTRI